VTIAIRPSCERETRAGITDFGKNESEIFLSQGLDTQISFEMFHEIAVLAHATLQGFCISASVPWSKIQVICVSTWANHLMASWIVVALARTQPTD